MGQVRRHDHRLTAGRANLLLNFFELALSSRRQYHPAAGLGEQKRNRLTDSPSRARDERNLSV